MLFNIQIHNTAEEDTSIGFVEISLGVSGEAIEVEPSIL